MTNTPVDRRHAFCFNDSLIGHFFCLPFSTQTRADLHLCAANAWLHCHGQLQGAEYFDSLQQPFFSKRSTKFHISRQIQHDY